MSDRRRGLFSYEALATRLADNPFSTQGVVDTKGPVVRLESLSREDLFVLLKRITTVHANGIPEKEMLNQDGILTFYEFLFQSIRGRVLFNSQRCSQYVGLLNVLEQNPSKH